MIKPVTNIISANATTEVSSKIRLVNLAKAVSHEPINTDPDRFECDVRSSDEAKALRMLRSNRVMLDFKSKFGGKGENKINYLDDSFLLPRIKNTLCIKAMDFKNFVLS